MELEHEILTLKGEELISSALYSMPYDVPFLLLSPNTHLHSEMYPSSALLDQIKEQLFLNGDTDPISKVWIFVNFEEAFPLNDNEREGFDYLFRQGFDLQFSNDEKPYRFVPFLNSSGQSKRFIYGFIKYKLYQSMRDRLDLGFNFDEQYEKPSFLYVSKLYSYRALYSSGATLAFRYNDPEGSSFFNEESIVVLNDEYSENDTLAFTVSQKAKEGTNEVEIVDPEIASRSIKITCFDGEGIISESARDLINSHLPKQMRGNSFQVRMPFFKGMLHTVDFHKFLRDMGVDDTKEAFVVDAFGQKRDLFKAKIVVTTSTFKLYGLLDKKRRSIGVMSDYFAAMKKYNHGLYIVKTESSFHNTEFVSLNPQLLTTLDLSPEDLDSLIDEHLEYADGYCAQNLMDDEKRKKLYFVSKCDEWMSLLLSNPAFLRDARIQSMLKNYRRSRYNDISQGRIQIRGENRFLSGDLLYFLFCLFKGVQKTQPDLVKNEKMNLRFMRRAFVYIPGNSRSNEVALLRNPHLSRNEDVCAEINGESYYYYYKRYLSHLTGVIFVGHCSYIPAAMGGADFDGDHVIITYDKRIINACKKGYQENLSKASTLPFIHIPTLSGGNAYVEKENFVSPQVIYNTFSNRIGIISNAAMKIAAVEYDKTLPKTETAPSASLCTVLTGAEIDATKKGLRPDIDSVIGDKGNECEQTERIVAEVENYIKAKKLLETYGGRFPKINCNEDGVVTSVVIDGNKFILSPNREHNAVTQLLYRWAEALNDFKENDGGKIPESVPLLEDVFADTHSDSKNVLKILKAYDSSVKEYARKQKKRRELLDLLSENKSKILMRLAGQYDSIDLNISGISYRDRMDRLIESVVDLSEEYTKADVVMLKNALFSEKKDTFNVNTYWPYGQALENNDLFEKIFSLPDAELLYNFNFEGYRLLYYLLDDIIIAKDFESQGEEKKDDGQDEYLSRYCDFGKTCFIQKLSTASFEKKLAQMAYDDLCKELDCYGVIPLIKRIYPPATKSLHGAFWKIFTVFDMLMALRGEKDVK